MSIGTYTGASSEPVPSGDVGVDMTGFPGRFSDESISWLGLLTTTGGAAATFELWGRRGGLWGLLGAAADGDSVAAGTPRYFEVQNLQYFDRVIPRCAGAGPTSYTLTLEDVDGG